MSDDNPHIRPDYADHMEARAEGMRSRAARNRGEAGQRAAQRRTLLGIMNGQPILVGHHSEGRHRRDLARMDASLRREIDLVDEAAQLDKAADRVESGRGPISADDPEAIDKLRAKLASVENRHARRKLAKKIALPAWDNGRASGAAAALVAAGFTPAEIQAFTPHPLYGDANPWKYETGANATAEIRRIKARIAELQAHRASPAIDERIGEVHLFVEENRVRLRYPAKPPQDVREFLSGHGFHWSRREGVWQRPCGSDPTDALYWARLAAGKVSPAGSGT